MDSLDEYLPWADYVLCCLPKTAQTDHLLGESRLRSMKADAVLVNAGRGNLIDLNGLCRVLNDGHLWGVGLDVAEEEPLPPEHPIWNCQRCMITLTLPEILSARTVPHRRKYPNSSLKTFRGSFSDSPCSHRQIFPPDTAQRDNTGYFSFSRYLPHYKY